MATLDVGQTIHATIIGAFTFTAAFLWRDVINDFIELFVPAGNAFFYKVMAAIFATILLIAAIYLLFLTEDEFKKIRKRRR